MIPENPIKAELEGISPLLAELTRQLPYSAPLGYFEAFSDSMMVQVSTSQNSPSETAEQELAGLSPLLAGLPKNLPFQPPAGYFEKVADEVNAGVSGIEQTREVLETLSPLLSAARTNPYQAPSGYFEELPGKLVKNRPRSSPVISLHRNWIKFAAVAAMVIMVAMLGWLFKPEPSSIPVKSGLAIDLERDMHQLSDQAFFDFADSTQVLFNGTASNLDAGFNDNDIHLLLEEVSDGALQDYLKEQPGKANMFN